MSEKIRKRLQFNEKESSIFIPNEIFDDLLMSDIKRNSSHISFAYTFYYLSCWLYRYAKYGQFTITSKEIKQILGVDNPHINYIIKKDGLLDQLDYTFTSKDYPISWEFNEGDIRFEMLSDFDKDTQNMMNSKNGKNYKIKVPIKALWRSKESEEEDYLDGTIYEIDNTHEIPFEVLLYCLDEEKKGLGIEAFYLYCYLKYKNDKFPEGYKKSLENLSLETGIKYTTLSNTITLMRKYNMIEGVSNMEYYVPGIDKEKRKPNGYYVNHFDDFWGKPFKAFTRMKLMKLEEYEKLQELKTKVDDQLEMLPSNL